MSITRVYGPPGCGKTTWVIGQVEKALESGRYRPDAIIISSFSRAAFREFRDRLNQKGLEIPEENLGTLHSLGYRSILRPEIALEPKHVAEWNKQVEQPWWAISPRIKGGDLTVDPYGEGGSEIGDQLFDQIALKRNRMIPVERWKPEQQRFWSAWKAWKEEKGLVDFADMIAEPLEQLMPPPKGAELVFVDEAQDLSPLQHALVMHWSGFVERTVLVGDDDQSIYAFQGASASVFLQDTPKHEIVLSQSFRVPRAVQRYAEAVIGRVQGPRKAKEYKPRDAEGAVSTLPATPSDPYLAVELGLEQTKQGQRVMYLASAKYMLDPLIAELRGRGIPYHNPFAPSRREFNPLSSPNKGQTAGWQRVAAFLKNPWSGADIAAWAEYLSVKGVFAYGAAARKYLTELPEEELVSEGHECWSYFTPEALQKVKARDLDWYEEHLLSSAGKSVRYAVTVAQKQGPQALFQVPQIVVGTIHSVKGGEAETVMVFPSLSRKAVEEALLSVEAQDNLHRLFYVAMTRAREELVLLAHDAYSGPDEYRWPTTDDFPVVGAKEEYESVVL